MVMMVTLAVMMLHCCVYRGEVMARHTKPVLKVQQSIIDARQIVPLCDLLLDTHIKRPRKLENLVLHEVVW
jgi:hypothetical protein